MARQAIAFLVHGVGLPPDEVEQEKLAPLLFGTDLDRKLRDVTGGDGVEIVPIEWHHDVPHPISSSGFVNVRQLAALMRGFVGAAGAFRDRVPWTQRLLSSLVLGVPFAALAFLYLLAGSREPLPPWPGLAATFPWLVAALRVHLCEMLGLLAPRAVLLHARVPAFVYLALLVAAALAHFANAAARAGVRNGLRSVFLSAVIRPLTYIGAAPLSLPVILGFGTYAVFSYMNAVTASRQLGVAMHPVFGLIPNGATSINDQAALGLGGGMTLMLLLVVLMWFIVRKSAWYLKVVADVLCYLGDPAVAEKLMERVDASFRTKRNDGENVIFVGHSLGSVVLFQWLLTRGHQLADAESVAFVTMGSPLRRWVAPFFSTFPAVDEGAIALKARLPRFTWLNIYRPYDPIGGALFVAHRGWARDQSTEQKRAFHAGYFGDPVVIERIYRFLAAARAAADDRIEDVPKLVEFPTRRAQEEIDSNNRIGRRLASVGGFALALLATVSMVMVTKRFIETRSFSAPERIREQIDLDPVNVGGWVFTYEEFVVPVNIRTDTQSRPDFTGPIEVPRQVILFRPLEQSQPVAFDLGRSDLRVAYPNPSAEKTAVATSAGFMDAQRYRVAVRYLKSDPQLFTIPAFATKSTPFLKVIDDIAGSVAIIVVMLVVFFSVRSATEILLRVYCGDTTTSPDAH